ncbi:hypothetical protein ES708_16097 [subsurface metagenome]
MLFGDTGIAGQIVNSSNFRKGITATELHHYEYALFLNMALYILIMYVVTISLQM